MATHGPSSARSSASDWLLFSAVWLALILVGIKAVYLGVHAGFTPAEIGHWIRSLAAISHADLVFVVAFWMVGRALIAVAGLRRGIVFATLIIWMIAAATAVLYAVASAIAFGSLGGFLTFAPLNQVVNVRMLSSSVTAYLRPSVLFALIVVPAAYLVLVAATVTRRARGMERRALRSTMACALIIAWVGVGHYAYANDWVTHYDWRIADNAPWVLAISWWRAADSERAARLADSFPPEYLIDFEAIGQQQPTATIARKRGVRPPRP